jgi:phospholipase C
VISPYAKRGYVSHTYTDHVSVLKFIERNWKLQPLSSRSLDRLPNPVSKHSDPYVPTNGPAIGDLFDMLAFQQGDHDNAKPHARNAYKRRAFLAVRIPNRVR